MRTALGALLLLLFIAGCGQKPIRVGSKASIENETLGEMLTLLAGHSGEKAEHRAALGGTQTVFQALSKGQIDIYAEYTGTLTAEILKDQTLRSEDDLRAALAGRGLVMTRSLGFNNTYALGLPEEAAERLGLRNISDLAKPEHAGLKLGFSEEFMNRADGWPGLQDAYRLPHRPKLLDHGLAYRGLTAGAIDVTDLYSTDSEIEYYKLRVLADDRGCFPEYHCVLLYRSDLASRAPALVAALSQLEGAIDNAAMSEMNTQRKIDNRSRRDVAAGFLNDRFKLNIELPREPNSIWLATQRHLLLVCVSLSAAVLMAVPLGIWSYKWPKLGHGIMAVVGIVQTLPSMAVLAVMLTFLPIGPAPAIVALFLYSLLPIVRSTLTGLKEIPGHLKESAIVLGLSPRARLWLVELPMASRSILSGIKTAAVINVGTATIGSLVGAGGYGDAILSGIRLNRIPLILEGAVPAAVLALVVQFGFDLLEPLIVPKGLRLAAGKG